MNHLPTNTYLLYIITIFLNIITYIFLLIKVQLCGKNYLLIIYSYVYIYMLIYR